MSPFRSPGDSVLFEKAGESDAEWKLVFCSSSKSAFRILGESCAKVWDSGRLTLTHAQEKKLNSPSQSRQVGPSLRIDSSAGREDHPHQTEK